MMDKFNAIPLGTKWERLIAEIQNAEKNAALNIIRGHFLDFAHYREAVGFHNALDQILHVAKQISRPPEDLTDPKTGRYLDYI